MPFLREDRARQRAQPAAHLGYLRLLALWRLASNRRQCPGGMRYRRQFQVLPCAVESIVEVAEQILLAELDQHIRAHQSEHGLSIHVGEQNQSGRASSRERVEISVVAMSGTEG